MGLWVGGFVGLLVGGFVGLWVGGFLGWWVCGFGSGLNQIVSKKRGVSPDISVA